MPVLKSLSTKSKSNQSNKRQQRQKIYQSKLWKDLRSAKLIEQPLCEQCLSRGIVTPATDVHHIETFVDKGELAPAYAYDYNNLMSLCRNCHNEIHNNQGHSD